MTNKLTKLSALVLALITCATVFISAVALFTPKNVVLAEEVQATSTQTSESITIHITTYPENTTNKAFTVSLTAEDGVNTNKENNIASSIKYTVASDYSSITVECVAPFDGKARLTIRNVAKPSVATSCLFKYKSDFLTPNQTVIFRRWENVSYDKTWVEDETFYLDGEHIDLDTKRDENYGVSNGQYGKSDFAYANQRGFAGLYYDANYSFISTEHTFTKGEGKPNEAVYHCMFVNTRALESLNAYSEAHPTQYGVIDFYADEAWNYKLMRLGDFRFNRYLTFDNSDYAYVSSAALEVLYGWMQENPNECLFTLWHNVLSVSNGVPVTYKNQEACPSFFLNKYFVKDIYASNVEIDATEYTFNN